MPGAVRQDPTELFAFGVIKLSCQCCLLCFIHFRHSPSESLWCEKAVRHKLNKAQKK